MAEGLTSPKHTDSAEIIGRRKRWRGEQEEKRDKDRGGGGREYDRWENTFLITAHRSLVVL